MKLNISKEWCQKACQDEADYDGDINAGHPTALEEYMNMLKEKELNNEQSESE